MLVKIFQVCWLTLIAKNQLNNSKQYFTFPDKCTIYFLYFYFSSLLMPQQNHQPRIYICNDGTTRTCRNGFSTLSGLTCHQNATHLPLNDHNHPSLSLTQLPPSGDMDFDVGTNACGGGMSPVHDGRNNPMAGPQQVTQGGAQTLHHPILNGKWFITHFLVFF